MYKLKEVAKRGSALLGAASLLVGIGSSALPALASADALNPLTERSLTLSSSSPGWSYLDGSGNTLYAPPNSGANGQKTGNTFSFKVSSTSPPDIKGFTFQYCTSAAGNCTAPGNDGHTAGVRNANSTSTSDLNIVTGDGTTTVAPSEIDGAFWSSTLAAPGGSRASHTPNADGSEGNFIVLINGTPSAGWGMTAENNETGGTISAGTATGKNNYIKLTNSTGESLNSGDTVKIIFFGTDDNYMTNPGAGAFFVRINDYSDDTTLDDTTIVDGGVTVANVMNQSISIQTKVLETMDFSVGVHNPDTDDIAAGGANYTTNTGLSAHGQCDPILTRDNPAASPATYAATPQNVLRLGDSGAEYSLRTDTAYDVFSYLRLSSNSSGGATVYYTGHTLTNTENDQVTPLTDSGSGTASQTGTEQFGLAIDHDSDTSSGHDTYPVFGDTYDSAFTSLVSSNPKYHNPQLYPLVATTPYGGGNGSITSGGTAKFSFNPNADTYAIPIATEGTDVVNCVTAKIRYVANVAATTPAGIYTTKVNYVASPRY